MSKKLDQANPSQTLIFQGFISIFIFQMLLFLLLEIKEIIFRTIKKTTGQQKKNGKE